MHWKQKGVIHVPLPLPHLLSLARKNVIYRASTSQDFIIALGAMPCCDPNSVLYNTCIVSQAREQQIVNVKQRQSGRDRETEIDEERQRIRAKFVDFVKVTNWH